MRIRNHIRSNVIGYVALFFALTGTALAANTISSTDIINGEVKSVDIGTGEVRTVDIGNSEVRTVDIGNSEVRSLDVDDESLGAVDLGLGSVGASEIADDTVGSAEITPGVVGADELSSVHEHTGTATNVVDGTAHDGIYQPSTSTVACGTGEDLLSVSVDWTDLGGHNEVVTSGVDTINRGADPETATVRVAYDGGAGPATYQAVATCIGG